MAFDELQRLLESKRLAGQERRNPYNMFKVVMLKCVSDHDKETPSDRIGWKHLGFGFGRESALRSVEYGVLIRGTRTRNRHSQKKPQNLNFEAGWTGWQMMGSRPQDYQRNIERVGEGDVNISFTSKNDDVSKEGMCI